VVIRDHAVENKSREVIEFFESKGIKSYFSTPYEQWQNGHGNSLINSFMTLALSVIVEWGLGGQFRFSSAMVAKDAHNVMYKDGQGAHQNDSVLVIVRKEEGHS
jgi:hypothetical protein